jgi:hypothetical protein
MKVGWFMVFQVIFNNILLLSRRRLGRLSFESISQKLEGIHLKLGILVHYQKRNQLQQGK